MSEIESSGVASTEVSAPTASDAPVVESSGSSEPVVSEVPSYSPNFKFKVHDQEHEFDEYIRGVIKDKDTEEKVRSLYAKAFGLDVVKPKYEKKKAEYDELFTKHNGMVKEIQSYAQLSKTDLRKFFQMSQIPEDKLFSYVLEELKLRELPEEHRNAVAEQRRLQDEREALLAEKQQIEGEYERVRFENHTQALETVFADSEVSQFESEFDKRAGQKGAFRAAVQDFGSRTFQATGEYVSPVQAVQQVFKNYAPLMGFSFSNQQQQNQESPVQQQTQQPVAKPPVIPNVGSGGSSAPGEKVFKSLDDLRKFANGLQ